MKQEKAYKIKLIKILEILRQDSDEDHYIESTEILSKLATMGIECDRRTLYGDIDVLNDFGYEVLCEKNPGKPNKYCVVDRTLTSRNFAFLWTQCRHRVLLHRAKPKSYWIK